MLLRRSISATCTLSAKACQSTTLKLRNGIAKLLIKGMPLRNSTQGVLCFNPRVSDNPEPNYIVLDTGRHAAALFTDGQIRDCYQWHSTA